MLNTVDGKKEVNAYKRKGVGLKHPAQAIYSEI